MTGFADSTLLKRVWPLIPANYYIWPRCSDSERGWGRWGCAGAGDLQRGML